MFRTYVWKKIFVLIYGKKLFWRILFTFWRRNTIRAHPQRERGNTHERIPVESVAACLGCTHMHTQYIHLQHIHTYTQTLSLIYTRIHVCTHTLVHTYAHTPSCCKKLSADHLKINSFMSFCRNSLSSYLHPWHPMLRPFRWRQSILKILISIINGVDIRWFLVDGFDTRWNPKSVSCGIHKARIEGASLVTMARVTRCDVVTRGIVTTDASRESLDLNAVA